MQRLFSSGDYFDGFREYIFILHAQNVALYLSEKILEQIVQKGDVRPNQQGGFSFYTRPKTQPADTKSAMITHMTTSAADLDMDNKPFAVFPIPARDLLHISLPHQVFSCDYELIHISGRIISREKQMQNNNSIDKNKIGNLFSACHFRYGSIC